MAFKGVSRVELMEVICRWQRGLGLRAVARTTGLSRSTVRKYVQEAAGAGVQRQGAPLTEAQVLALAPLNRSGPKHPAVPSSDRLAGWHERIERWGREERLQLTRILANDTAGGRFARVDRRGEEVPPPADSPR